jgi:hypothetical protein
MKALEINNFSIKFVEWVAENHYRLYNLEKNIYYWDNKEGEYKTTKQLLKEFINEN